MKTLETQPRNPLFVGVLDGIAEALGRPPRGAFRDRDGLPD